jgi:hypothetical protein
MLIKRALDDLSAIGDAARSLPRIEREALRRLDALNAKLDALLVEMAPIREMPAVRAGIDPLDDDMRAVRDSVDDLEPLIRELAERLEALRSDMSPLGELADRIPGINRR